MQIMLAEPIDLIELVEIDKEVIGSDSRKKDFKEAIESNRCLVAKRDSTIVGFLIYHTEFFDCSFIKLVMVHPLERNKGYAKTMMRYFEIISPTEKIFSSTNHSNIHMQNLFKSVGYVKSGFVENLDVGDPEIIYFKKLNGS